jgi:hypothetical protein
MPNEFGYPGIPTHLQNRSKTRFDNENLSQRQKLGVDVQRPPSMEALYEDEPSVEELLAQAQGTLDSTAPTANIIRGAGLNVSNPADDVAAAEQGRTERTATREYRNAALSPLMATSFVPGPIGAVSQGALGAAGMMDAADDDLSGGERVAGAALGALSAVPAMRALRGAKTPGPVRPEPGMHWTARQPAETPYKIAGELPSSPSMQALRQNSAPEADLIGEIDLSDAINSLSGPTPLAPGVARARAAERFGRNYRSESTAELPPVLDEAGRVVAPTQAPVDPAYAAHVASSRNKKPAVTAQDQERMRELIGQLFGENPSPAVSRMTAQQALADDAVIGMTKKGKPIKAADVEDDNVLFGGASARQFGSGPEAGEFVRPKDRKPIGKKPNPPAWRFGREEAVQWNQR